MTVRNQNATAWIAIGLTLLTIIGGSVWWGGRVDARVDSLENAMRSIQQDMKDIPDKTAQRVAEKMRGITP